MKVEKRKGKLTSGENIPELIDELVQAARGREMDPKTGVGGEMRRAVIDGRVDSRQIEPIQPMPEVESIGGVPDVVERQGSGRGRREGQWKWPIVAAHPGRKFSEV